jgi:hypothetical protein
VTAEPTLDDAHAALRRAGIFVPDDGSMDMATAKMLLQRLGIDL